VRGRDLAFRTALAVALAVVILFLTLPVVSIFVEAGPAALLRSLGRPATLDALWLSLETSAVAMVLVVLTGAPAAYVLATRSFRGRSALVALIELPLVLPPAVAGIGLLAALGPAGLLGAVLERADVRLVFETAGVVVALAFVAAPFFISQAYASFSAVDRSLVEASRTLGASEAATFLRVVVPSSVPGLASGLALAWGRALGEFGATLIFAGSLAGVTRTAPLAIYAFLATDLDASLALAAVLVALSGGLLLALRLTAGRSALFSWR
jgi:molybdate transport system permease protein